MRGRTLVGVLLAALIAGALAGVADPPGRPSEPRVSTRPNVLLIVIDTLRADHLGSYGYERETSPYLDNLARAGTRFTIARAPSSWTGASVASLLTGLTPLEHGLQHRSSVLSEAHPTMAEAFRDAGYETVAFSANPAFVTPEVGLAQGFTRFEVLHGKRVAPGEALDTHWDDTSMQTLVEVAPADRVSDSALAWLGARTHTGPFFAYLHYFDPHAGYHPPPAFADRFGVPASAPLRGRAQHGFVYSRMRDASTMTAAERGTLVALYDAEIAFTDLQVGRVLLGLLARKAGPTVIVVTSDHGEEFGDHGGLQHSRTLFEELIHVPLIVTGAGVPPGRTVDAPVSLMDVWPLLADLTGVPAPAHLPRHSLRTLARGDGEPFFADLAVGWGIHSTAVIDGDAKLIRDRTNDALLYDLARDPGERHERAAEAPARVEALAATLRQRAARARTSRTRMAPVQSIMTPERRAQLEALGYLE